MPIGNYTSQFLANVYLDELDQFVKHKLKAAYYIRYVDDFVILHESQEQLEYWKKAIDNFIKRKLHLELHPDKSQILTIKKGTPFLGFKVFYHYKRVKKSNIQLIKGRIKEWKKLLEEDKISQEKIKEGLEGWIAHAKYGNTHKLRKELLIRIHKGS